MKSTKRTSKQLGKDGDVTRRDQDLMEASQDAFGPLVPQPAFSKSVERESQRNSVGSARCLRLTSARSPTGCFPDDVAEALLPPKPFGIGCGTGRESGTCGQPGRRTRLRRPRSSLIAGRQLNSGTPRDQRRDAPNNDGVTIIRDLVDASPRRGAPMPPV